MLYFLSTSVVLSPERESSQFAMPYRAARPALSTFCLQSSRWLPFRLLFLSFIPSLKRTYLIGIFYTIYIYVIRLSKLAYLDSEYYYSLEAKILRIKEITIKISRWAEISGWLVSCRVARRFVETGALPSLYRPTVTTYGHCLITSWKDS